jgi:hypothetical protein
MCWLERRDVWGQVVEASKGSGILLQGVNHDVAAHVPDESLNMIGRPRGSVVRGGRCSCRELSGSHQG